jgi:hypothetical protein
VKYFVLLGKEVFETDDFLLWSENLERNQIVFGRAKGIDKEGMTEVSTVFLGQEGQFFETMIFGGWRDGAQYRWNTYNDAIEGHRSILIAERKRRAAWMRKRRDKKKKRAAARRT